MPHRIGIHAASRYPADPRAIFILALLILIGLPLIIVGARPDSVAALLPRWGAALWGFALVGGSITTLYGMSKQTVDGVITEQIGSVATGVASLIYAVCIGFIGGETALVAAAYATGFGLSCFWRWGQLQVWLYESKLVVDAHRCDDDDCGLPGHQDTEDPIA